MALPPNPNERVLVALALGLLPETFELFRVRIYDSGAEESLKELSRDQVEAIANALLPDVSDAVRLERLREGIEVKRWTGFYCARTLRDLPFGFVRLPAMSSCSAKLR